LGERTTSKPRGATQEIKKGRSGSKKLNLAWKSGKKSAREARERVLESLFALTL